MIQFLDDQTKNVSSPDKLLITALANLDNQTFAHSKRVQVLALVLGKRIGLTSRELDLLKMGALLHDIGKQYIPKEILDKEAALTPDEWEQIQLHPIFGWQCVASMGLDETVERIILDHHLWANGEGGYPRGFGRPRPCILTKITTVADVADAMTQDRPYRPALGVTTCMEYLEENSGARFDRDVVGVFKTVAHKYFASFRS